MTLNYGKLRYNYYLKKSFAFICHNYCMTCPFRFFVNFVTYYLIIVTFYHIYFLSHKYDI